MPATSRHILINAPIDTVFAVISDFDRYPEFIRDVKAAEVVEEWKNECEVEMTLRIMRDIRYTLHFSLEPPHRMDWHLVSGEVLRKNTGSWELAKAGKAVRATYTVEVGFGPLVPAMIGDMLVNANLPTLLQSVKQRAEALVAGSPRKKPKATTKTAATTARKRKIS